MPLYRKKPVVIEARQFVVTEDFRQLVVDFINRSSPDAIGGLNLDEVALYTMSFRLAKWCGGRHFRDALGPCILIDTLEGQMRADPGDWIIKGVKGEFYPCKPDIFAATYEVAE
ncbi:MAG TPA: hypothetical protein PKY73_18730 [Hyphomonas sp.]|nr:hypothetical protein [Hyphomonas sp.]